MSAATQPKAPSADLVRPAFWTRHRPSRPPFVPRPRLVSMLRDSTHAPIALVTAPAGYGKTTALLEWEAADERPFAWLTLEERHNDPALLIGSIARALNETEPVDEAVFAALSAPRPNTPGVVVPRLCESLLGARNAVVLVLDDVQVVQSRDTLRPLTGIAESLPSGSTLVLASRDEPAISVGRLRAHRRLVEVTTRDLVMTRSEGVRLLEAAGLELRPSAAGRLVERTEGWPAALYLAALSLRDADDLDQAIEDFAGDDRVVADYLREEFVCGQPPDRLAFLIRTSVLDRLSGPLCDAVLDGEGSAEILRQLSRSNLLLVPLDRRDEQYRYHALLREMLLSELHRLERGEVMELHSRASTWFAEHADVDRAVSHAVAAGDVERAGHLIWARTVSYASAGLETTLERWLSLFSEEQIAATPSLALALATCRLSQGDGAQVERWTATAIRLLEESSREDGDALKVAASVIKAAGAATDGVARMRDDAARAYELLPEDSPWRSICRLIEGAALHLTGERERARSKLEEGARRGAAAAPHVQTLCLAQLALLALDEDDLDGAAQVSDQSIEAADRHGLNEYPTSALLFAAAALVRARRGRMALASSDVKRAIQLLGTLSDISPWYEAEVRIAVGRALIQLDDIAGARAQLADAGRFLNRTPDATVLGDWLEQAWREADPATTSGRWPLTPAELRVLRFLPTHLSLREIAEELVVSPNTVKTQAQAVYRKLGVSSRTEAVSCAHAAGMLDGDALPLRRPPGQKARDERPPGNAT
jgi:LuxR family transcriptional regulator, maltose regulon positive regulatory protein